jgi:hypothetical protein
MRDLRNTIVAAENRVNEPGKAEAARK